MGRLFPGVLRGRRGGRRKRDGDAVLAGIPAKSISADRRIVGGAVVPPAQSVRRPLKGKVGPHQGDHPLHQPAVKGVGEDGRNYPGGFSLGHALEIKAMFINHFLLPLFLFPGPPRKTLAAKSP